MSAAILARFRELMTLRNLNLYVLPRTDQHQSQNLCNCDQRVFFLSGFSGSNAIALISHTEAFLWTDSRYFLQAEQQLGQGWKLKKMIAEQKKWFEHIAQNYPKQTRIGVDARLLTVDQGKTREKYFTEKEMILEFMDYNLADQIWENRPKSTASAIFSHEQWAGKSIVQKVGWVRNQILAKKGKAAVFSDLSQIAWLLNLRSSQIPYTPSFKCILSIGLEEGYLYLPKDHPSLNDQEVLKQLASAKIGLAQYEPKFEENSLIVKSQLNYSIYKSLVNPIQWTGIGLYRAVRTQKQLNGFRRCHIVDGVAMAKFWSWRSKQVQVNQYQAAMHINNLRTLQEHNKGISFVTISCGGSNGAIIHYHPKKETAATITRDMVHLVDSGGQYLDGTTDVTRAFHFGQPTPQEKDAFTRVLLGNLDIQRLKWPKNVKLNGRDIDAFARRHLWAKGLDYGHGTGHGVGYYQNVHESPVGISKGDTAEFQAGMIVTNQPGYYEPGKFGIRIENILVVIEQEGLLGFENITLCPYDKNLIDIQLLTVADRHYIDHYHQRVWETLSGRLQEDKEALEWLRTATSPL